MRGSFSTVCGIYGPDAMAKGVTSLASLGKKRFVNQRRCVHLATEPHVTALGPSLKFVCKMGFFVDRTYGSNLGPVSAGGMAQDVRCLEYDEGLMPFTEKIVTEDDLVKAGMNPDEVET